MRSCSSAAAQSRRGEGGDQGGQSAAEIWPDKPPKARQGDRWTLDGEVFKGEDSFKWTKPVNIAIPLYGYKFHISIDRMHELIRRQTVTDAARHDGGQLREGLIARTNTARSDRNHPPIRRHQRQKRPEAARLGRIVRAARLREPLRGGNRRCPRCFKPSRFV